MYGARMAWAPDISRFGRPHYAAIADAIAADLQEGRLAPGTRLPPQRELADQLGLNLTTVARGYVEAQRRGLIESRVGQGTFVSGRQPLAGGVTSAGLVDLAMNLPPEPQSPALRERMAGGFAAMAGDLQGLLRYHVPGGSPAEREAAVRFLAARDIAVEPDRVLLTPGTHVAFQAILQILARPGDVVLSEAITYPGIRGIAVRLGLRLEGVPVSAAGMDLDALAELCAAHRPRAIYLNPTLLNPTAALMPVERRRALIDIARRHDIVLIEDDAYGALLEVAVPAFASLAPDMTYFVSGLSKTLGAGLRVAHVIAPDQRALWALASAVRAAIGMASPIGVTLSTLWINDGTADAIVAETRAEIRARQALLGELVPPALVETHAEAFHGWLRLPPGWNRASFIDAAKSTGLSMVESDAFTVGTVPEEAMRLSLGGALTRDELRNALTFLGYLLDHAPLQTELY